MNKMTALLGLLLISSTVFAQVEMTQTQLRILSQYDKKFILEKEFGEPIGEYYLRELGPDEITLNVFPQGGPKGCYRVKMGEVSIDGEIQLVVKQLMRDLSCDKK